MKQDEAQVMVNLLVMNKLSAIRILTKPSWNTVDKRELEANLSFVMDNQPKYDFTDITYPHPEHEMD